MVSLLTAGADESMKPPTHKVWSLTLSLILSLSLSPTLSSRQRLPRASLSSPEITSGSTASRPWTGWEALPSHQCRHCPSVSLHPADRTPQAGSRDIQPAREKPNHTRHAAPRAARPTQSIRLSRARGVPLLVRLLSIAPCWPWTARGAIASASKSRVSSQALLSLLALHHGHHGRLGGGRFHRNVLVEGRAPFHGEVRVCARMRCRALIRSWHSFGMRQRGRNELLWGKRGAESTQ